MPSRELARTRAPIRGPEHKLQLSRNVLHIKCGARKSGWDSWQTFIRHQILRLLAPISGEKRSNGRASFRISVFFLEPEAGNQSHDLKDRIPTSDDGPVVICQLLSALASHCWARHSCLGLCKSGFTHISIGFCSCSMNRAGLGKKATQSRVMHNKLITYLKYHRLHWWIIATGL